MEENKTISDFPLSVFPVQIQHLIEDLHEDKNFPVAYIASAMLSAVSIAIGGTIDLPINGKSNKARLYMALVGRPGANKTGPISFAMAPLNEIERENVARFHNEMIRYRSEPSSVERPVATQVLVNDITTESVAKVLMENPRGIGIRYDELSGFFQSFNRYSRGGGDEQFYLSVWSGEPVKVNRKSIDDILYIQEPYVSLIGGIQPGVLSSVFGGERLNNGLFQRMLFVMDKDEDAPIHWKLGQDLPSNAENEWRCYLRTIIASTGFFDGKESKRELRFSSKAAEMLTIWQNQLEDKCHDDGDDRQTSIFRKMQLYALRFAIIVHVMHEAAGMEHSDVLRHETICKATVLANYYWRNSEVVLDSVLGFTDRDSNYYQLMSHLRSPGKTITTAEAVEMGLALGMCRRTVMTILSKATHDRLLKKTAQGCYMSLK